jgi:alpha-muurolene/germacrene-A/gamma-muurolene synthase
MRGLQASALTAYCYNTCPSGRLRLVCDFLNFLFHLDDVSDGYLARDAEGLANIVMNAFEWPDSFRPLPGQPDGIHENNAGKLARE